MTAIGKRRQRVVIQQVTRTPDGAGGFSQSWSTFATIWADVEERSGSQVFFSESLQKRVTHKITARYLDGVTTDMRVLYQTTRLLQVQWTRNPDGRKKEIEIWAEEGKAS